jgi:Mycotoxin biosynthesis protein UstYa
VVQPALVDGNFTNTNIFKGKPSKELDEAWDTLLSNTHVRVSREELDKMNVQSVALSDSEGGHLAALG